jgi:CxxC motif-containing protein (DUF1111 family)
MGVRCIPGTSEGRIRGKIMNKRRVAIATFVTTAFVAHAFELNATNPNQPVIEAPAAFDNLSNGYLDQAEIPFADLTAENVVPLRSFDDNRFIFEEVEGIEDGLGPVYNAQSCRECHQNVVTGGASQIAEVRAAQGASGTPIDPAGGSLIHSRAIHPTLIEHITYMDDVRSLRLSLSTLGDGYVECIDDAMLLSIRDAQPEGMKGTAVSVPVLEAGNQLRLGRFGWKNQEASLESFSAGAYLNEMGITSPMLPIENTSAGEDVASYDKVPDPEDDGVDIKAFADFMRATKAPPPGQINEEVMAGGTVFKDIGCAVCHTPSITTAAPGTVINGGSFVVPPALGNKVIHPYSDFLMHDIGSGDGIPTLPGTEYAQTATQMRTAPLRGLRTRNRLMHDGLTATFEEAIDRHGGQAESVKATYFGLPDVAKQQLMTFLGSL